MLTPDTTQAAVMFLISVGSLATSELKERWTLRRKQQQEAVDLSKSGVTEAEVKPIVEELLSAKPEVDVSRTLDLVHRKRKLVYDAQREKLNAKAEHNRGRFTLNELELTEERCDQEIKTLLAGIDSDLQSVGIAIERQIS